MSVLKELTNAILTSRIPSSSVNEIKIPQSNIPKFNGNFEEWLSFRNIFKSVVDTKTNISNAQKLQYLQMSVLGEAKQLISHFQLTDENYDVAWKHLCEAYDNPKLLVKTYVSNFLNLKKISNDSQLRKLNSDIFQIIDTLDNLDIYGQSRDPWLISLILERVDSQTQNLWSVESSKLKEPKLSELREFLRKRISDITYNKTNVGNSSKSSVKSLVSTSKKCVFCQKDHDICLCSGFNDLNVKDRSEFVKKKQLCFNCLQIGHSVKFCSCKTRCEKCQKKHNKLLHFESGK